MGKWKRVREASRIERAYNSSGNAWNCFGPYRWVASAVRFMWQDRQVVESPFSLRPRPIEGLLVGSGQRRRVTFNHSSPQKQSTCLRMIIHALESSFRYSWGTLTPYVRIEVQTASFSANSCPGRSNPLQSLPTRRASTLVLVWAALFRSCYGSRRGKAWAEASRT